MRKGSFLFKWFVSAVCVFLLVFAAGCNLATPPAPPNPPEEYHRGIVDIEYKDGAGMSLSWAPVADAARYRVFRAKSRLSQYTELSPVTEPAFTDGAPAANKYENYYKVSPVTADGTALVIGLKWAAHANAASYEIYRTPSGAAYSTAPVKIATASAKVATVTVPEYYRSSPSLGTADDSFIVYPLDADGDRFVVTEEDEEPYEVVIDGDDVEPVTGYTASLEQQLFGENTLFYDARYDDIQAIADEINGIHDDYMFSSNSNRATGGQFSYRRYQFYFKPGTYEGFGTFNIGYYTAVSGLGALPTETQLNGTIQTRAPLGGGNATCTFWRSTENFEVNHPADSQDGIFQWAVSQAAPSRRMSINVPAKFDWNGDRDPGTGQPFGSPWASGGFLSDSRFTDVLGSANQQQWYSRNSDFAHSMYSGDNWNRVTQGVTGHPYESGWSRPDLESGATRARTNIDTTPIVREKPFLYLDGSRYKVFVPDLKSDASGITWNDSDAGYSMGLGKSLDLENDFYVASPGDTAETINAKIVGGKHILFAPGWYGLEKPIRVTRADTVLLGTGYATLFPDKNNTQGAIFVDDVPGVTVASLMLDAHYDSEYLIRMGEYGAAADHSANPSLLADVFLRVGGYMSSAVNADVAVQINSNHVIGDHLWVWRADHGNGVSWTSNTCDWGLLVTGDHVTMYGLFVEHYQKYQTLWLGEYGRTYFYQNELPYDPPYQDYTYAGTVHTADTKVESPAEGGWYSHGGTVNGWSAYKVGNGVQNHYAIGLGCYGVFNRQSQYSERNEGSVTNFVFLQNAVEVPNAAGVKIEHIITTELGGRGGTTHIINGTGMPVGRSVTMPHGTNAPGGTGNAQARRIVSYQNGVSVTRPDNNNGLDITVTGVSQPGDEDYNGLLAHLFD